MIDHESFRSKRGADVVFSHFLGSLGAIMMMIVFKKHVMRVRTISNCRIINLFTLKDHILLVIAAFFFGFDFEMLVRLVKFI